MVETLAAGREATKHQPAVEPRPSKANHVLRFLRRTFAWGLRFGLCEHNPGRGVRQVQEVGENHMPELQDFYAVLQFARERGQRTPKTEGSVPPYLWAVMVLAYYLRLRGIEVDKLTDAHATDVGIQSNRRKGSLDNITPWNDELREAWDFLLAYRKR